MIPLLILTALLIVVPAHGQTRAETSSPSSSPSVTTEPKSGARYRQIPAGSFLMGCVPGDEDCDRDEKPRHQVTIRSFLLAETETTSAQYRRCVIAGACEPPSTIYEDLIGPNADGQRHEPRHNHPVAYVSWEQSVTFCRWVGGRLPTEAEWEYAARGGEEGWKYPWGNTLSHEYANYGREKCCAGVASGKDRWKLTAPVASFRANGFGLYDMSGNVWEWTADWYDAYSESSVPRLHGPKSQRVLRGGSWYTPPAWLRASDRGGNRPSQTSSDYGFRCALDLLP